MRWVGIDEAGYGPNLGPLVIAAVVAEGPGPERPDVWRDRSKGVSRQGGHDGHVRIDDSKKLYRKREDFCKLEASALAAILATGSRVPTRLSELLRAVNAGTFAEVELERWLEPSEDPLIPREGTRAFLDAQQGSSIGGVDWRLVSIHIEVVGPERFNQGLARYGMKSNVLFDHFTRLLKRVWAQVDQEDCMDVEADKQGARNTYYDGLMGAFPETWIDRGLEGNELSRYALREGRRRLDVRFRPKADAHDGFVALASIVAKLAREHWMLVFNRYWSLRVPGIAPTAGYPVDAKRFREEIAQACCTLKLEPRWWWREK